MSDQLIAEYESKVRELQGLVESGHISESEYYELVEDFTDLDKVTASIQDENLKIHAEKVVTHLMSIISLV